MQDLKVRNLVWAIMKAETEEQISRFVSDWHESAAADAELMALDLARHIAGAEFQKAKEILAHAYGRHNDRHKGTLDVLVAASQNQRMLRMRETQKAMDEMRARSSKGITF